MDAKRLPNLLTLLTLFGVMCLGPLQLRKELNEDDDGDARFLMALFVLGAVDFVHQAEQLTYGEFRHLSLETLLSLGWPPDGASTIFDIAVNLQRYGEKRAEYGEEAMVAGANAFRKYYGDNDPFASLDAARLYFAKWKGVDLSD